MAWIAIPATEGWEYNDAPTEPPTKNIGQHNLWFRQTDGIRTVGSNTLIYTETRRTGSSVPNAGELSKSYWDYIAERDGFPPPSGGVPVDPPDYTDMVTMDDADTVLYWDSTESEPVEWR